MNSSPASDYYSVLGVPRSADAATIRKAYLKLSLKYHPDKNIDQPEAAKAQFVRIGEAYEVLSDEDLRAAYDASARDGANFSNPFAQQQHSNNSTTTAEEQRYNSYREAFDATMAGLSEDDLRGIMGAAAVIGSVVGSILGSRMMSNASSSSTMRNMGSMVGSLLASEAASTMVRTAHEQSRERASIDQDRRARGQSASSVSAKEAWDKLISSTAGSVKEKAAEVLVSRFLNSRATSNR